MAKKLFGNPNPQGAVLTERQSLELKYENSRKNLLLVLVFSLVNVVALAANTGYYFLFSAYFPVFLVDLGFMVCGKYPIEIYEELGLNIADFEALSSIFPVFVALAVICALFYLLFFFLSRKGKGAWMIVALVFFCIDSVFLLLLGGFDVTMILDYVFHAWVIYALITGVMAYSKLKKLPEDEPLAETSAEEAAETVSEEAAAEEAEAPADAEESEEKTE